MMNAAFQRKGQGGNLARVEIVIRSELSGRVCRRFDNDEIREAQPLKSVIRSGEALELGPASGRCQHTPE
jgi:hypothetical protein